MMGPVLACRLVCVFVTHELLNRPHDRSLTFASAVPRLCPIRRGLVLQLLRPSQLRNKDPLLLRLAVAVKVLWMAMGDRGAELILSAQMSY